MLYLFLKGLLSILLLRFIGMREDEKQEEKERAKESHEESPKEMKAK